MWNYLFELGEIEEEGLIVEALPGDKQLELMAEQAEEERLIGLGLLP